MSSNRLSVEALVELYATVVEGQPIAGQEVWINTFLKMIAEHADANTIVMPTPEDLSKLATLLNLPQDAFKKRDQ
jgi:hypothetical protein